MNGVRNQWNHCGCKAPATMTSNCMPIILIGWKLLLMLIYDNPHRKCQTLIDFIYWCFTNVIKKVNFACVVWFFGLIAWLFLCEKLYFFLSLNAPKGRRSPMCSMLYWNSYYWPQSYYGTWNLNLKFKLNLKFCPESKSFIFSLMLYKLFSSLLHSSVTKACAFDAGKHLHNAVKRSQMHPKIFFRCNLFISRLRWNLRDLHHDKNYLFPSLFWNPLYLCLCPSVLWTQ